MYTQYLELKMKKNNPELADYLKTRLFCNKTRKPYKSEPYDELHEEFNRRGMRFQNNRSEEEFANSFTIVNDYHEMRNSLMSEMGLSNNTDQKYRSENLQLNVMDMRQKMRSELYLSRPDIEEDVRTLSGEQLDDSILEITKIASDMRQQNLVHVMNRSDFFGKYSTTKIDFFSNETAEPDIENQIKIIISCIEDKDDLNTMYQYWSNLKNSPDYNEEIFLNDLIDNKINP